MKDILFFVIAACLAAGCDELDMEPYSGKDTVQFYVDNYNTKEPTKEYFWAGALNPLSDYDTCWITVQTVGHASPADRRLKVVQEVAMGWNYTYDLVGNVVDSTSYVVANQAVVDKHYLPFDAPEIQHLMKMPANAYKVDIPIVMKRDTDVIKKQTLQIRLVDTEDVVVGNPRFTRCVVTIE